MKNSHPKSGGFIQFAVVADDNTGATDAAGMLTERGVRTLLILNRNHLSQEKLPIDFGAYVYSTTTRSLPKKTAYRETAFAVKQFKTLGTKKIQIKYSSTFDSTPKGNIGPSLDAALDILKVRATIVSPALPVNERTTYFGYHFVNGILISESPLRHHPLNPITDPSLIRWLSKQTDRKVGLAPLNIIRKGEEELSNYLKELIDSGISYIMTDTIDQTDLKIIARATKDWQLISGGSGITAEIPELLFTTTLATTNPSTTTEKNLITENKFQPPTNLSKHLIKRLKLLNQTSPRTLIAAGSCTPTTIKQNEYAIRVGFKAFKIEGKAILENKINFKDEAKKILNKTGGEKDILIYTSSEPEEVKRNKEFGNKLGLTPEETGRKIVTGLAHITGEIMKLKNFGKLCISGGETSGIICKHLGINVLEVGLPIEPGVPYCFTFPRSTLTGQSPMNTPISRHGAKEETFMEETSLHRLRGEKLIVLKSGNFGSENFYERVRNL